MLIKQEPVIIKEFEGETFYIFYEGENLQGLPSLNIHTTDGAMDKADPRYERVKESFIENELVGIKVANALSDEI